jgi:hypothetical protein
MVCGAALSRVGRGEIDNDDLDAIEGRLRTEMFDANAGAAVLIAGNHDDGQARHGDGTISWRLVRSDGPLAVQRVREFTVSATQEKFAASSVLPVPFHFAT